MTNLISYSNWSALNEGGWATTKTQVTPLTPNVIKLVVDQMTIISDDIYQGRNANPIGTRMIPASTSKSSTSNNKRCHFVNLTKVTVSAVLVLVVVDEIDNEDGLV